MSSKEQIGNSGGYNNHCTGNSSVEPKCCFCNKTEKHIVTNEPKETKIAQNFGCQKFAQMAPKERFQELKNKEKHCDGECRRHFVCQRKSHDKYPIKKHVLVFHEHRENAKNQEFFQKYKKKFIMKQQNWLQSFSKDLRLISYELESGTESSRII